MKTLKTLFILSTNLVAVLNAQVVILDDGATGAQVNLGETYTQNFNSLANSAAQEYRWHDNVTLPGWYSNSEYIRDFTGLSLQHRGPAVGQGDRALGVRGELSTLGYFSLRIFNQSSSVLNGLLVGFDGEQWTRLANNPQRLATLVFDYQIFPSGAGSIYEETGWTNVPELNFVSPNASLTNFSYIDGNAPENSVRDIHSLISGITVEPGQEIWLRWGSLSIPYLTSNHDLAIDNLSVSFITAIPEPAAFAGLAGGSILVFAVLRRRRSAR